MASKADGALLSSSWISNGFDGVVSPPVHPPFPLSKWTEFDGAAEAVASKPPAIRGNHRFGSVSYNSFFSRHNPHPFRVTHLKGNCASNLSINYALRLNRYRPIYSPNSLTLITLDT